MPTLRLSQPRPHRRPRSQQRQRLRLRSLLLQSQLQGRRSQLRRSRPHRSLRHQSQQLRSQVLRRNQLHQSPQRRSLRHQSQVFPRLRTTKSNPTGQCHGHRPSLARSLVPVRHVWRTTHFLLVPPRSVQHLAQAAVVLAASLARAASLVQAGSLAQVANSSAQVATVTSPPVSARAADVVHRRR